MKTITKKSTGANMEFQTTIKDVLTKAKELNIPPDMMVRVIVDEIDLDADGKPMPPESAIKESFIKAVEASGESYKKGDFKSFSNVDDLFDELNA